MKSMKLIVSAMICALLFAASSSCVSVNAEAPVWDGITDKAPTVVKTIDDVYYYEISTPEELFYIVNIISFRYIPLYSLQFLSLSHTVLPHHAAKQ